MLAGALVSFGLTVATPPAAVADSRPADPATPATVTADPLPTVQIDGVAWSQVVVNGIVYVAGEFTTARPAGAAPGTSTVARSNLLAYDLDTGNLVTSWAPSVNGAARAIAASPDGRRIYVGGDFSQVNGASQTRFVALDAVTGQRVAGFNPAPNASVRAITATATAVYFGGNFNTVAGQSRLRLAALSATTGALLSWNVSAESKQVDALVMSPDGSRVIVGGRFQTLNRVAAKGSGSVSATTGQVQPWAVNTTVTQYGDGAGITSLSTDGTTVYGAGFAHLGPNPGSVGNLEGIFAADPNTGALKWVEDCHGDTYSVYANPGKDSIYGVGHPHYCGNIGGFGETGWKFALAFGKRDVMTITPETNTAYFNWGGKRAPELLDFYPEFTGGTYTGTSQAAWHVTGSGEYVVFGGEFTAVNGAPQQGLVRMATSAVAPNKVGPGGSGPALQPAATSEAAGTAQVSWPTNWDKDNGTLRYEVLRSTGTSTTTTKVYETTALSSFWQRPRLSFTDTGLTAGTSYTYRISSWDPFGNRTNYPTVAVTAAGTSRPALSRYAAEVLGDNPEGYWRLGETSGNPQDWTGNADATAGTAVTRGVAGALSGDGDRAARFTGTSASRVYTTKSSAGLNRFSVEAWVRTTSTGGGRIVGFGSSSTASNSTALDRLVYMQPDGRLSFGVEPKVKRLVTTPEAYNDGQWHHVVATLGPTGMRLYVDGAVRAESSGTISGRIGTGVWRIGGDAVLGWPSSGAENFAGDIDEVAVYGRPLTATEVASHRSVAGTTTPPPANQSPTASFTTTTSGLAVSANGTGSRDPDGSIASYAWTWGDGGTSTGATASHTYADAGTYSVGLTVTDNAGAQATSTASVTVASGGGGTPPPSPVTVASDSFGRTFSGGWGTAELGGAWSTNSTTSVSGGVGVIPLPSANSSVSERLPNVTGTDLRVQATAAWDKRPSGEGGWWLLRGRITSGGEYRLKVGYRANGSVTARLVRAGSTGAETQIASEVVVPGLTYSAGTRLVSQIEVTGVSPTTIRAKVWAEGSAQPSGWLLTASDSTAGLQTAGHTGLAAILSGTVTNLPVTVRADDYSVVRLG